MKRISVPVLLLCIAVTVCVMFAAAETAEDGALPDYVYPGDDPVV